MTITWYSTLRPT